MKTFPNLRQGSSEWLAVRRGVVTASEVDAIISPTFQTRTGKEPETFLFRKLAEKLLGWSDADLRPGGGFSNFAMEQGHVVETIARPWFAFQYDCEVATPGFCLSDDEKTGCSPDGLVGDDCGLEIKAPQPPTHLKYLIAGGVPPEYVAQIHFSMFVTGRARWKFVSYSRQFDPLVIEVKRDEEIQKKIASAVASFYERFDVIHAKFKGQEDAENARKTAEYYAKEGITP